MNYAIDVLEQKLEDSKVLYDQSNLVQMQKIYESEIEDLVWAIEKLKFLDKPIKR